MTTKQKSAPASTLLDSLVRTHGWLIGGAQLVHVLAFPSAAAFRQAKLRGKLPVRVFPISGRRGHFALTTDVADWLATISAKSSSDQQGNPMTFD